MDAALAQAWQAIGGSDRPAEVRLDDAPILPARLPVGDLAKATVAACALAARELAAARGRPIDGPVELDAARIATSFVSERHLRVDGREFTWFAPYSGFFAAADGWVRTHANYPHHLEALQRVLGEDIAAAIHQLPAVEVEDRVNAAGGLAFAARTAPEWAAHPQGRAVARLPLVQWAENPAPPRTLVPLRGKMLWPASGVRVLDLTRVIAGPVATRTLAFLGADVLRVDGPRHPEIEAQHLETGLGKRSTLLDLSCAGDRSIFESLLHTADVVVMGYRPGALAKYGLSPEALWERHPGLVIARLSAWGTTGPWAHRRGFDSLVQAATGIACHEGSADKPGVLPAQALDHGTGYLLAAAVLRALALQHTRGNGHLVELALARTAQWLLDLPTTSGEPVELSPTLVTLSGNTYAQPPVVLPGGPTTWAAPSRPWGADPPQWI
jgi:crotonobetainyl-CoA:carnitine CoA-transferase CaiB-like acyl-CoA transferase